jgi:hypothetical protein
MAQMRYVVCCFIQIPSPLPLSYTRKESGNFLVVIVIVTFFPYKILIILILSATDLVSVSTGCQNSYVIVLRFSSKMSPSIIMGRF